MSSMRSIGENWLLVEWNNGSRDVVYIKSVVKPVDVKLEIGEEMTVIRKGEPEAAKLIARARERDALETMIKKEEVAGPSTALTQDDEEDFSSSASSWTPHDDDAQSDDSNTQVKQENKNLERYKRQYINKSSKKVLTPSNKANAVVNITRKRTHNGTIQIQNNTSSNTATNKKNVTTKMKMTKEVKCCVKDILYTFKGIFKQLEELKKPVHVRIRENPGKYEFQRIVTPTSTVEPPINLSPIRTMEIADNFIENEHSENEEFNRSDDNVLITNKYKSVNIKTETNREKDLLNKEWVPIGSGKTLIHRDKFKKINWKSYTVATRTLLMAVFPRRVLATHSLTGKCSPAFKNKPAKMCLDPKKTSDIILEIMDRFKVRENLVRGIITTKCADECKMWKMRNNMKKQNNKGNVEATDTHLAIKPQ